MRADITERGVVGDRAYAIVNASDGKVASAKHPVKCGVVTSDQQDVHDIMGAHAGPSGQWRKDRIGGMAFQCDMIPVPMPEGWVINCEDPVVFAEAELR